VLFVSIQWGLESAGRFGWLSRTILVGLKAGASLKEASSHLICSCKCHMQHLMGAYHIPILKKHMKNTHKSLEQGYHGGTIGSCAILKLPDQAPSPGTSWGQCRSDRVAGPRNFLDGILR